jgi:hypothetical protein
MNNMGGQMQSGYPSPRAPPLVTTKSNSLSLPDSPNQTGQQRGRSNSLRVSFSLAIVEHSKSFIVDRIFSQNSLSWTLKYFKKFTKFDRKINYENWKLKSI